MKFSLLLRQKSINCMQFSTLLSKLRDPYKHQCIIPGTNVLLLKARKSEFTMDEVMTNVENIEKAEGQSQPKVATDKVIRERSAEIVSGGHVFYNPVQEFNRDLSTSVLNVYFRRLLKERAEKRNQKKENKVAASANGSDATTDTSSTEEKTYVAGEKYADGMRILEALAATGLRSIRYAKEVAGVREIVANDLSQQAVESIRENVRHNGVEHLIEPSHADAMTLMYLSASKAAQHFDAIDLDPYGCPNRFLDGAIQCVADGGLLLITATDMAVLTGNTPEACFVKYGSVPLRTKCCHEMALRILLHCIDTHAIRYGKYIEPLLSISADFYVRVFVRVFNSQAKCKYSMSKRSMVYQCTGCETYTLQPLGSVKPNPTEKQPQQVKFGLTTGPAVNTNCEHCGHKHHVGGPIWSAPIHDQGFVQDLLTAVDQQPLSELGTQRRIVGMLSVILEELPDVPLYYTLDKLCSVLRLEIVPTLQFRSVLLHEGYSVSYSHACKNSIKTDAPAHLLWDVLRCWNKTHPVKAERLEEAGTPLNAILSKPCAKDYIFHDLHPLANPYSRRNALSRFQPNPTAHWGPGTRATIMIGKDKVAKSVRNQNKKQKQKSNDAQGESNAASTDVNNSSDDEIKCKQAKIDI